MNERDFVYWLNGFAELSPMPPTAAQWKQIKDHLELVFKKVTPPTVRTPAQTWEVGLYCSPQATQQLLC